MCCAPCAIYPYSRLKEEGFDVAGFFYNPNIHPYQEYRKRFETIKEFAVRFGLEMMYQNEYNLDFFFTSDYG